MMPRVCDSSVIGDVGGELDGEEEGVLGNGGVGDDGAGGEEIFAQI